LAHEEEVGERSKHSNVTRRRHGESPAAEERIDFAPRSALECTYFFSFYSSSSVPRANNIAERVSVANNKQFARCKFGSESKQTNKLLSYSESHISFSTPISNSNFAPRKKIKPFARIRAQEKQGYIISTLFPLSPVLRAAAADLYSFYDTRCG
jgi:hypothetical protein